MSKTHDARETYLLLKRGVVWVKHGFLYVRAKPAERLSEMKLAALQFPIRFKYNHSEGLLEEGTTFGDPDEKYWSMNQFVICDHDLNTRSLK